MILKPLKKKCVAQKLSYICVKMLMSFLSLIASNPLFINMQIISPSLFVCWAHPSQRRKVKKKNQQKLKPSTKPLHYGHVQNQKFLMRNTIISINILVMILKIHWHDYIRSLKENMNTRCFCICPSAHLLIYGRLSPSMV